MLKVTMPHSIYPTLNIAYRDFQVVEILLQLGMLLGHVFIFALPLVPRRLEGLHLALVMAGLDIGLAEPNQLA